MENSANFFASYYSCPDSRGISSLITFPQQGLNLFSQSCSGLYDPQFDVNALGTLKFDQFNDSFLKGLDHDFDCNDNEICPIILQIHRLGFSLDFLFGH